MQVETLFGLAMGVLLLGPPLGVVVGWRCRDTSTRCKRYVYSVVSALLAVAALVSVSPWSFRGVVIDACLVAAAYVAYCVAASTVTFGVRERGLRLGIGVALAVPMAFGYLLGTIGALGVAFVVGAFEAKSGEALSPELSYRTYDFGNATTANGGTVVEIYVHPMMAPFLERRLFHAAYDFREHDLGKLTVSVERESGMFFVAVREDGHLLNRLRVS